eukprot:3528671-Pyramimonas_sp.AAC.1
MLGRSLQKCGVELREDWLALWRGCDVLAASREAMMSASPGPIHVFKSVWDYIPAEHLAKLRSKKVAEGASNADKAAAHVDMRRYLKKHGRDIFKPTATCGQ